MFTFCASKQCFFALSDLCSHFVQENNVSLALIDLCSQFARKTMFLWF